MISYGEDYADPWDEPSRAPSTWHTAIDLTQPFAAEDPDLCDIGNGGIFYRGRVNMIIGESESGKSWVAVAAVNQAQAKGEATVWFDFDSTPSEVAGRFACTGGVPSLLSYYRVEDRLNHPDDETLITRLQGVALVVIDGMSDHYGLQDVNDYKGTEVTAIMRRWQRIATATGAGVIMIDHISRGAIESGAKGAAGSQAKRAKVTGTSILVKGTRPMGRGLSGWADLVIDKDRGGQLRPRAADGKKLATFNLDATQPDRTVMNFRPFDQDDAQRGRRYNQDKMDAAVLDAIAGATGGIGRIDIQYTINRRKDDVYAAINRLLKAGEVANKGTPSRPLYVPCDLGHNGSGVTPGPRGNSSGVPGVGTTPDPDPHTDREWWRN